MIDFSNYIDLPLIWGFLIATAVFMYAILDGFDLGCGILFPFAPSNLCRNNFFGRFAARRRNGHRAATCAGRFGGRREARALRAAR